MSIIGIGTDIVDISRLSRAVTDGDEDFLRLTLNGAEIAAYRSRKTEASRLIYLGCCWAAKEAFAKAVGCGFAGDLQLTDITVHPGTTPRISLDDAAKKMLRACGGAEVVTALGQCRDFVTATVIVTDQPL